MDLLKVITSCAVQVQQFFRGPSLGGWVGAEIVEPKGLPVWLKQAARYGRFPSGEVRVTLIVLNDPTVENAANIYRVFNRTDSGPALVLADALSPKSRGVLVRMGIPHIVSGGSIYAPELGVAYGRLPPEPVEKVTRQSISPVALKLTAAFLLRPEYFTEGTTLSDLQQKLTKAGYSLSKATLSRSFQQLMSLDLVECIGTGPHKRMYFKDRSDIWSRLVQIPAETVVRKIETSLEPPKGKLMVYSGDSALAVLSEIAEPQAFTYAMSISTYRKWKESRGNMRPVWKQSAKELSLSQSVIELWREDPTFLQEQGCVNSIELALSLRNHPDERVQIVVAEILRQHGLDSDLLFGGMR